MKWSIRKLSLVVLLGFAVEVEAVALVRAHPLERNTSGVLEHAFQHDAGSTSFAYTALKRCALVGSSSSLSGKRLGAEIDAHDTVIRVNRLPSEPYSSDFGKRTDVLFGNRNLIKTGVAVMGLGSPEDQQAVGEVACDSFDCGKLLDCRKGGSRCKFGAVVFKQDNSPNFLLDVQAWSQAPFPVGATALDTYLAAESLLKGRYPSTGFVAFLTYVALCDELRVYGFDGAFGSADGHTTSSMHPLDLEHFLMRRLADGKLDESAWKEGASSNSASAGVATKWIQEHILMRHTALSFSAFDPHDSR